VKRNHRDPLTGKVSQVDRDPAECEKLCREFPHLRIIDDETFEKAQRRLSANRETYGARRKAEGELKGSQRGVSRHHPRHLLSGLLECQECGRTLHFGGANGKYLFCPGYAAGTCGCKTQLRRDRGERMILDEIGKRILENPGWRQRVLEEMLKAHKTLESSLPDELNAAREALALVERKITKLVNLLEGDGSDSEPNDDDPELKKRLAERRAEKRALIARTERLARVDDSRPPEPTEAWVDQGLRNLGEMLAGGTPAAALSLRNLIGGKIVVREIREAGRKRNFLRGQFTIAIDRTVNVLTGSALDPDDTSGPRIEGTVEEIVIDFRDPLEIDAQADRAKQLYDEGMMNAQIAQEMGVSRSRVTKLLRHWFESRGLAMPDGRSRRSTLWQKQMDTPQYQEIADEVMRLCDRGELLQEIAEKLGVDRNTITSAIRWWHESRGLPVPDGRSRRKELKRKTSSPPKSTEEDTQE